MLIELAVANIEVASSRVAMGGIKRQRGTQAQGLSLGIADVVQRKISVHLASDPLQHLAVGSLFENYNSPIASATTPFLSGCGPIALACP